MESLKLDLENYSSLIEMTFRFVCCTIKIRMNLSVDYTLPRIGFWMIGGDENPLSSY